MQLSQQNALPNKTMKHLTNILRHKVGLVISLAMYYWQPGKLKQLRRFFRTYLPPNALCFDLGAHLGNRTKVWRQLGATVVAIEPQASCLQYLERRFGDATWVAYRFAEILPIDLEQKQEFLESDDVSTFLKRIDEVLHK